MAADKGELALLVRTAARTLGIYVATLMIVAAVKGYGPTNPMPLVPSLQLLVGSIAVACCFALAEVSNGSR